MPKPSWATVYVDAVVLAAAKTGLPVSHFSQTCPFDLDALLTTGYVDEPGRT